MEDSKKINKYTLGGISGILILCAIILVDEFFSVQYGGDCGAFLWTTFHFILNPIFCGIYIVLTGFKWSHSKERVRFLYVLGIAVALFYLYVSISGNTFWIDIFGINFNTK